jgi:DnaK suppressor protein
MNEKKKSVFKDELQTTRAELMGGIGKTIKTSQEEESTQHIPDPSDSASQSYDRQLLLTLGQQDWEKLKLVDEALRKLTSNEFGICEQCEKPIPEARLDLVPFAQYCVMCLNNIEQEKNLNNEINSK